MKIRRIFIAFAFALFFIQIAPAQHADALVLYRAGRYAEAIAICEQEIIENPENIDSYCVLCWSLVRNRQYAEAEQRSTDARKVNSTDVRLIEIQGEGHILGFAKDVTNLIWVKKVNLAEGDIIFACTDGLIDTKSLRGDVFGKSRVQNSLTDNMGYPASKMAQFAYNSLVEFTSKELEDDVTVLVLKYLGDK